MRKARVRSEVLDKEALWGGEIINENTGIESDISGMDDLASSFKFKTWDVLKNIIKMYEEHKHKCQIPYILMALEIRISFWGT